jgi:hypothetical protein
MTYKVVIDPGHSWLRVPLAEIEGMLFSDYSYADGKFAYLEEDCDAPKFMEAKSLSHEDTKGEYHDNGTCFVRNLGGLPTANLTSKNERLSRGSVVKNAESKMYEKGTTHPCKVCGKAIATMFDDKECTKKSTDQDTCWPCLEFGGPVEDMDLWDGD